MPMGFCYPGKGATGDLPPRPECAPLWHSKIVSEMKDIKLTILIGQYAQKYYLGKDFNTNITGNIRSFKRFMPDYLPLVHPSPRNRIWQKKNPWFESTVIPFLQQHVKQIMQN
jgi:uracil-DNA glycosylase